jgi:hypothetical protein
MHFFFIAFIISFLSDYVLRYATENSILNTRLDQYFANYTPFGSAFIAGYIIVIALLISSLASTCIFNYFVPHNKKQLLQYCAIAFVVGYIADVYIMCMNIYPDLKPYYEAFSAGLIGSITLIFVVILSYFTDKKLHTLKVF